MNDRYEAFCMASPLYYDTLHAAPQDSRKFPIADRAAPDGWGRFEQDDWIVYAPEQLELPSQGWKIHTSATLDNAEKIIEAVWQYCVPRGIEFKFLRSSATLWLRSSKYAPRGYSGKLVTIYPVDESACEQILRELGDILQGCDGPYILSDVRWASGPLYVRYGGYAPRYCVSESGQVVLGIEDDTGTVVPDRRDPVFYVPPWVTVPDFLAPHIAARGQVTVGELRYTFESVMHFSNGGGLYRGRDRETGAEVVLKEARPHAGLDAQGADAVARVHREHDTLRRLAGIPGIPEVYESFTVGDHHFIAMEFVEGRPLRAELVQRYPMINVRAEAADFASYTDWALDMYRQVEVAVQAMHERGVVYGDLHLFNIMVRPDGSIALLDFETASLAQENARPALGNQGFAPPRGVTGTDVDLYALACLRLALFLPVTQLLWLSRTKVFHLVDVIREHFDVPAGFLEEAVALIAPPSDRPPPRLRLSADRKEWPDLRDRLVSSIRTSATPERDDRLFPGDIEQFRLGGLGLAYGAGGVLYALSVTGAGRFPQWEEWLLEHAAKPPHGTLLGLYDGLHGTAFALDHLGHHDAAMRALDACMSDDWQSLELGLLGGLSGIGLNLAHFTDRTGEPRLAEALDRAAELVAARLGDVDSVAETSGPPHPYAGLFRGSSGPAVFLMRMFDRTGDPAWLDRAAVALRQDLRRSRVREDSGAMEVDEGWRTMPYLAAGSVGVGFALDEYLARRPDERFADASRAIRRAARSRMYVQPGLFAGRGGILLYLTGRAATPERDADIAAQIDRLAWHALPFDDGIAFPGDQLLRLSMDLATGTAGVLLALGAALHDAPVHLPLLASTAGAPATAPPRIPAPPGRGLVTVSS